MNCFSYALAIFIIVMMAIVLAFLNINHSGSQREQQISAVQIIIPEVEEQYKMPRYEEGLGEAKKLKDALANIPAPFDFTLSKFEYVNHFAGPTVVYL